MSNPEIVRGTSIGVILLPAMSHAFSVWIFDRMSARAVNVPICLYYVSFSTSFCVAIRVSRLARRSRKKVIIDKMEKFSVYIVVLLTLLGTSPTSANTDNEGTSCF